MPELKPLAIWRGGKEPSWYGKRPDEQTIRDRAEFLAHEIFSDVMAPEAELADAIEVEIRRFAAPDIIKCPRCSSARIHRTDYVHCADCNMAMTLPVAARVPPATPQVSHAP